MPSSKVLATKRPVGATVSDATRESFERHGDANFEVSFYAVGRRELLDKKFDDVRATREHAILGWRVARREQRMRINLAHLRERSTAGGYIDFAIFEANATSGTDADRADVLHDLTMKARMQGLKVDQSALAYRESGRLRFYGSRSLVDYLAKRGVPRWTHSIDL